MRSTERGDWVPVTDLSHGTLDVVYLAARLGLVRLVTGDRRPPLILDDPFVTLDDARAERALAVLRELTADFQVIYLTTSARYDALADAGDRARPGPGGGGRIPELGPGLAVVVLGLTSAITWGAGDFGGGLLSRRVPLFGVVATTQVVGHGRRAGHRDRCAASRCPPARTSRGRSAPACAAWWA